MLQHFRYRKSRPHDRLPHVFHRILGDKGLSISWKDLRSGAPNGSVPQNICSSGTLLLAGRCGRNNNPWKERVAGKKIIQGVRGDLKSRIAATGCLYGVTYHSRSELCPMKLPSKSGCMLLVCWLGTLPSVLLGVRNR